MLVGVNCAHAVELVRETETAAWGHYSGTPGASAPTVSTWTPGARQIAAATVNQFPYLAAVAVRNNPIQRPASHNLHKMSRELSFTPIRGLAHRVWWAPPLEPRVGTDFRRPCGPTVEQFV